MANKLTAAQQRTDDEFWVLYTLARLLESAYERYTSHKDAESRLAIFSAGLEADCVERAYHRVLRRNPHLRYEGIGHGMWTSLPDVLELGRKLVAEHEEQRRQRQERGAA